MRGKQFLLSRRNSVIILDYGYHEAARGDFRSRLGDGRKRGGATKARHARKVQRLMYVSLADVFVHRVVGNKNDTVLPGLGVPRLIDVGDTGKQRGARLKSILPGERRIGERRLKWRAVFPRALKRILQSQLQRRRSGRRRLSRIAGGRRHSGCRIRGTLRGRDFRTA